MNIVLYCILHAFLSAGIHYAMEYRELALNHNAQEPDALQTSNDLVELHLAI